MPGRNRYEIRWPNVARIETVLRPTLVMDWDAVEPLALDPMQTPISAEVAPSLAGQTDLSKVSAIDLEQAVGEFRCKISSFGLPASCIFRVRTRSQAISSTWRCN